MKLQQDLLGTWATRCALSDAEQFSTPARERIAAVFAGLVSLPGDPVGTQGTEADEQPIELAKLGIDDGLSASSFGAELRNCQLSLLCLLVSDAIDADRQPLSIKQDNLLPTLTPLMANLDRLIAQSSMTFARLGDASGTLTTSPNSDSKKGKTLQHEIRTPLQGALLTTELMLEDAGHGDPVSADDILAVRKSIETAVGILNDFANRATLD